jgi:hypothetical protein
MHSILYIVKNELQETFSLSVLSVGCINYYERVHCVTEWQTSQHTKVPYPPPNNFGTIPAIPNTMPVSI